MFPDQKTTDISPARAVRAVRHSVPKAVAKTVQGAEHTYVRCTFGGVLHERYCGRAGEASTPARVRKAIRELYLLQAAALEAKAKEVRALAKRA